MEKISRGYLNVGSSEIPQFRVVKFATGGVDLSTSATLYASIGVSEPYALTDNGATPVDKPVSVVIEGIAEADCGGNVSAGDYVSTDTTGKVIKAVTGDNVIGIALENGTAGSRIFILIERFVL